MRERARANFEAAEKKKARAEVAKLEEALEEARRGAGAAEVVRMAKDAANEGVKRAKTLVRDAKPLIEDGMRKAAPALKNAGERAKRGYARQIRNVQSNLAPVRRKMKAKMKQIDLLKPYATDRHINAHLGALRASHAGSVVSIRVRSALAKRAAPRAKQIRRT
jgi:polyhydroxyalkanoate synthesis regulator phasin